MGRHDERWSDRHRSAIGYAQCEQGLSSSDAVAAGERGELGLSPFKMPASTAREIAQAYQRGDINPPTIQENAEDTARRLQFYLNKRLAKLLEKDEPRFTAVRQLAEEQKAILAITGPKNPNRSKTPSDTGDETEERHDIPALLATLQNGQPQTGAKDASSVTAGAGAVDKG